MSRIQQRHARVASDFSIARILAADDNSVNGGESFFVKSVDTCRTISDSGEIVSPLRTSDDQQSKSNSHESFTRYENVKNTKAIDSSGGGGPVVRYVDDCRLDVNHSSFTSFGTTTSDGESQLKTVTMIESNELSWLQCTRYRPPKIPRKSVAGKTGKRRPGTHPRIPFTATQLQLLEDKYRRTAYLSRRDVIQLSTALRLPHSRVKIWFQNRRARDRRESAISDGTILSNSAPSTDKTKAVRPPPPPAGHQPAMMHNPI